MINFCTLFDAYYLDKGIVLYRSLEQCCSDFTLYIFCFDEKSKCVLDQMNLKYAVILSEDNIKTPKLEKLKQERTRAEYCWTCTTLTIEYVLDNFEVDNCTYIDSDLYFYRDPKIIINEIGPDEHIIISPHMHGESLKERFIEHRYGKYCVQFNYFDQNKESRRALRWWKERCQEWCYHRAEPGRYGDQKYLELLPSKFSGVHEIMNRGAGVAPWNVKQYVLENANGDELRLRVIKTGRTFDVIFYHFQSIDFIGDDEINIFSGTKDFELVKTIYYPYLRRIIDIRKELKQYDVEFPIKFVRSRNIIKLLYKKFVRMGSDADYIKISSIP